jgi:3' terminal RNA ribose 2'-O-methyltransferase Hen1
MLLTITYEGKNTTDLGYLLYKNPSRPQTVELNHGKAYVFYPEVSYERTTAALLLELDPIDLTRGKADTSGGGLFDYVNDRPYVSSSFMSTAISKVFGTAITGRADAHQELSDTPLNLTATVTMLPCGGEKEKLNSVFEPLGYDVRYDTFITDEVFPNWGVSKYVNLTINGQVRLRDLLKHLYVLIPVFDRQKHYWVGPEEVEKLLRSGEGWLSDHPEKVYITSRYLKRRSSLVNMAFERLASDDGDDDGEETLTEAELAVKPNLNAQRLEAVVGVLKDCDARRVIDIGCGEGNLLRLLVKERQFVQITGVDVSHASLERIKQKMNLESDRVQLLHGSVTYKDERFAGYDAACVIEVIEHLDIPRLAAFERVLFEYAKPRVVVLTTPNREYNALYEGLAEGNLRHGDHRFEWTRAEFQNWAQSTANKFNYAVRFSEIGDTDAVHGAPTQMGVFTLCE